LQAYYSAFLDAGAEIFSVVVAPLDVVEGWCQRAGVSYPMLADAEHRVAEAYGVYDLLGDGLAAPAVFVVAPDRRIAWSHVGQSASDRAAASMILEHLP
jgi:peroxiredoxin